MEFQFDWEIRRPALFSLNDYFWFIVARVRDFYYGRVIAIDIKVSSVEIMMMMMMTGDIKGRDCESVVWVEQVLELIRMERAIIV